MVDDINSKPGILWTAAQSPRFEGMPLSEFKAFAGGVHMEASAAAVKQLPEANTGINDADVPDEFDSATNWPQCAKVITDIRDQSNCGCCWAFGGTSAASDRLCIATNATLLLPLSAQDVCFNSNFDGCDGGQISTPWSYIKRTGVVTGSQQQPDDGKTDPFKGMGLCSSFSLPHCHHHGPIGDDPYPEEGPNCPSQSSPRGPSACDDSAKEEHADFAGDKYWYEGNTVSAQGETNIQQAIMEGGPMEVAFTV